MSVFLQLVCDQCKEVLWTGYGIDDNGPEAAEDEHARSSPACFEEAP